MSNLSRSQAIIEAEWSKLAYQWEATTAVWGDAVQVWFQDQYWAEYEPMIRSTLRQMEQLGQLLAQAQRDLE